ncbi:MAG: ribose 5-phosphate isomerase B [Candidatus Kapaibacterium sp.]
MKIALASDHAGFEYKKEMAAWLKDHDHQVLDFGTYSDESVDYPDYAFPAAEAVAAGVAHYGIVICGSGIGVSIVANKVTGIRSALCMTEDMAEMSRRHNNANVLAMGARLLDLDTCKKIAETFIFTEFDGGRHMIRVEKIHSLTGW